jgi:hypothetical protein
MQDAIERILRKTPGLKGKEIAKKVGLDRKQVNSYLHKHPDIFTQDNEYCWYLIASGPILELGNGWVTDDSFEQSLLQTGCLLDSESNSVLVKIPEGCKILLIVAARLLALLNQLASMGKDVTVDLSGCEDTKSFLSRAGFFDHLDRRVKVRPKRPNISAAKKFHGNSDTLVEFGGIDPRYDNNDLVIQLTERFVQQSNVRYQIAAFTTFSELIENVREHSESPIYGFAALQKYKGRRKHIQTVVSDSGLGIAQTLRPSLKKHYPDLHRLYSEESVESDADLVETVFRQGEISRFGLGRGLGFKSSCEQAMKLNADLSVRQERFYLKFQYRDSKLYDVERQIVDVPRINGSHLCFDFFVDPA